MDETKSFWKSKTIWGVIVTAVSLVASLSGHNIDDTTQTELINVGVTIGGVVGSILAIYGRMKADKPIKKEKSNKSTEVLILLLLIPVTLQGCALANLQPHEKALVIGEELKTPYTNLYDEYKELHEKLKPEQVKIMEIEVAPVMDKAKAALIAFRDAAAIYARTKIEPDNYSALAASLEQAIADASAAIAKIKGDE